MKKLLTLALMLLIAVPTFAQEMMPPSVGPQAVTPATIAEAHVKFLKVLLSLTQAQQDQATQIYTAAETAKVPLEASIKTAQAALVTAVTSNNLGNMTTQTNAIGTATAAIELAEAKANAAFNLLLTSDQKTKFAEFLAGDFVVPGNGNPGGNGHGHGPKN